MANDEFFERSRIYPTDSAPPSSRNRLPRRPGPRVAAALAVAAMIGGGAYFAHSRSGADARAAQALVSYDEEGESAHSPGLPSEAESLAVNATPVLPVKAEPRTLRRNETIYDALLGIGFAPEEVWALVKAAKPYTNLSRVRSGMRFTVWKRPDLFGVERVVSFQMPIAANKTLLARPATAGDVATVFAAEVHEIPYETRLTGYTGTVESSLWESAIAAGMDPNLIAELADVFAFSIDFTREVRKNDRYRLVVEQKFLEGKPAGYGRILAAEFVNGSDSHSAIHFENMQGDVDYFATDGSSLRRMFLRSPLRYSRISSRFGMRYHPIHKRRKAHQGVDYAAARGTPVRAVGDGLVLAANWNGGSGKFVKIRHNGTYATSYSHLNGYGPGVRKGVRVKQGQVIGYVGTTGVSTGPHLHFAFYENGRYINPLSKRFPAAEPVPKKERERFEKAKARLLPLLPEWPSDARTASSTTTIPVPPALAAPLSAGR